MPLAPHVVHSVVVAPKHSRHLTGFSQGFTAAIAHGAAAAPTLTAANRPRLASADDMPMPAAAATAAVAAAAGRLPIECFPRRMAQRLLSRISGAGSARAAPAALCRCAPAVVIAVGIRTPHMLIEDLGTRL